MVRRRRWEGGVSVKLGRIKTADETNSQKGKEKFFRSRSSRLSLFVSFSHLVSFPPSRLVSLSSHIPLISSLASLTSHLIFPTRFFLLLHFSLLSPFFLLFFFFLNATNGIFYAHLFHVILLSDFSHLSSPTHLFSRRSPFFPTLQADRRGRKYPRGERACVKDIKMNTISSAK